MTKDHFNEHGVDLAVIRAAIYADELCARCRVQPVGRAWWATFHREYLALTQPSETKDALANILRHCSNSTLPTPEPSVTTDPCDHDWRFRGVMFTRNGCLACECERLLTARAQVEAQHAEEVAYTGRLHHEEWDACQAIIADLRAQLASLQATATAREQACEWRIVGRMAVVGCDNGHEWCRELAQTMTHCCHCGKLLAITRLEGA